MESNLWCIYIKASYWEFKVKYVVTGTDQEIFEGGGYS